MIGYPCGAVFCCAAERHKTVRMILEHHYWLSCQLTCSWETKHSQHEVQVGSFIGCDWDFLSPSTAGQVRSKRGAPLSRLQCLLSPSRH